MVYFDGVWFKWVYSKETPFKLWTLTTNKQFLHTMGNFQNPLKVENRHVLLLDKNAKVYTFRESIDSYKLVFEWEAPDKKKGDYVYLLKSLFQYRHIYSLMRNIPPPPFALKEIKTRNPVKSVSESVVHSDQCLYAHKLDGVFGLVYSYSDGIKEKWEDYERIERPGITLGNGLIFAAEKMNDGSVVLLDVYQVRGHKTAPWSRPTILLEFLPQMTLPEGYRVQIYETDKKSLPEPIDETDGYIIHDMKTDEIFKLKPYNSIDLVYYRGYFWLPNKKRIPSTEKLEDGCIYEISTADGSVLRKRPDRFKGNTMEQIERELINGWGGKTMEDTPMNVTIE